MEKQSDDLAKISIRLESDPPFKSIRKVEWNDIPAFAVLTGLNGSGKTQLLELLAYKISGAQHPEGLDVSRVTLDIQGDSFEAGAVAYLPSRWEFTGGMHLGLAQLQDSKRQLYHHLIQSSDLKTLAKRAQLTKLLGIKHLHQVTEQQFIDRVPNDYSFMLDDSDVTSGLAHVFLAYRVRFLEALETKTRDQAIESLGPAPWELVNEILQAAGFPYRVLAPAGKLLDVYRLELRSDTGATIPPANLSSGEKSLLSVALWLYNSQHHNRFPRLLLLDEPDANLHPSMARHFLAVLKDVLVEKHHVRVILTTHSPTTVALAPEASLFEMSRHEPRIRKPVSKQASIGLLTSGFVTVSPATRYVLVEDRDDVAFYETVRDILSDYGPSLDPEAIAPSPSLVFLPASSGSGAAKIPGGCNVVRQWVEKLQAPPLGEVFRGVIDRDSSNVQTSRVGVIGRYSIENYLLDPFNVFSTLNAAGKPLDAGLKISQGDEHRIKSLSQEDLQKIVNFLAELIWPEIPPALAPSDSNRLVTFTNGKVCTYPAWMLDIRGHDLLSLYQAKLYGPGVVNPRTLRDSMRRVRLVPVELAALMKALQQQQA